VLKSDRKRTENHPVNERVTISDTNFGDKKGMSIPVPAMPDQIVTGMAPYLLTKGFERTEKSANDIAASTTSKGPAISEIEPKLGRESTMAPKIPKKRANTNLPLIFSFRRYAEKTAMKTGPKEMSKPATPEETVVSAKLSNKW